MSSLARIAVNTCRSGVRSVWDRFGPQKRQNAAVARLFDERWYLEKYPDVFAARANPLQHYLSCGAKEGRDPCPLFSTDWYLKEYPNVRKAGANPLIHYIESGVREGCDPCPLFDTDWYLQTYPDVAAAAMNPLIHYIEIGAQEGRNPSSRFETSWYRNQHPEIARSGLNPLAHYIHVGRAKRYSPSRFYDIASLDEYLKGGNLRMAARIFEIMDPLPVVGRQPLVVVCDLEPVEYIARAEGRVIADSAQVQHAISGPKVGRGKRRISAAYVAPYVAELEDVLVLPGTATLIDKKGRALNDELYYTQNTLPAEPKSKAVLRGPDNKLLVKFADKAVLTLDTAIHLTKEHEGNYFHWVVEVLPRLFLLEQIEIDPKVPVLVSGRLNQNLYELLDLVRNPERPVIQMQPSTLQEVRKLIYPSDLSRILDLYEGVPSADTTYVEVEAVAKMVSAIKSRTQVANALRDHTERKLYLRRRSHYRSLLNEREIEEALVVRGFELVDLNHISGRAQIELFSQASIIVGATGASMTNMVWCNPGTEVLILASDHSSTNMTFWEQLSEASRVKLNFMSGPRAFSVTGKHAVHDDFRIDVPALASRVDMLTKGPVQPRLNCRAL